MEQDDEWKWVATPRDPGKGVPTQQAEAAMGEPQEPRQYTPMDDTGGSDSVPKKRKGEAAPDEKEQPAPKKGVFDTAAQVTQIDLTQTQEAPAQQPPDPMQKL
eukprot:3476241-Amphidinium_carterae.1